MISGKVGVMTRILKPSMLALLVLLALISPSVTAIGDETDPVNLDMDGDLSNLIDMAGEEAAAAAATSENKTKAPRHYEASVTFRNELGDDIDLYWEGNEVRIKQDGSPIESHGGEISFETYPGHKFSYDRMGERHIVEIPEGVKNAYIVLLGNLESVMVECTTTASGGKETLQPLRLAIKPAWSPRGASRFLDLVREKYYDGVALHRVVRGFLGQFGISTSYEQRTQYVDNNILDDIGTDPAIPFKVGTLAFAGAGPDTRSTEVFVVMPGASQYELEEFGSNSWETPFGQVLDIDESPLARWYSSYGDMPPWGKGPDPEKIYEKNGYETYLKKKFPKLDYIESCVVINEVEEMEEEEL